MVDLTELIKGPGHFVRVYSAKIGERDHYYGVVQFEFPSTGFREDINQESTCTKIMTLEIELSIVEYEDIKEAIEKNDGRFKASISLYT